MLLNSDNVASFMGDLGPFGAKAQVGYDLSLTNVNQIIGGEIRKDGKTIYPYKECPVEILDEENVKSSGWRLMPGVYSLTFNESVKLDNKHTGFITHRSSVLRSGSIITSGVFDPGFNSQVGATMIVFTPITIEKNSRVAQLIIFENQESEEYDGSYQGDKDLK